MSTEHIVVHLFAVQFIANDDTGLALIVARTSNEATQILKNSGEHNCNNGSAYIVQKIQDIGVYTLDDYGILFEMYANAAVSYDAIITALDSFSYVVGPKGDKGDKGDPGSDAEVTLQNIISALGYTPASLESLSGKQDVLVSGTNIKTVNNQSILGEGNIVIEGGSTDTSNCVKIEAQSFTEAQQTQARANIGAGTSDFSGAYNDLTGKPTIPAAQIQSDWNQTNNTALDFIKNKPTIPSTVGLEEKSNKVTSISASSTNIQYPAAKCVYDALALKQDSLVSGTNIKTINNESILGSGNINISSGGTVSVDSVLSTTSENPVQNKVITTELNKKYEKPSGGIPASDIASGVIPSVTVTDVTVGGTSVVSGGIAAIPAIPVVPTISTNVVTDKASDIKTSSPKSVYDEIHPASGSSQPSGGMLPNVLYNLGTLTGSVTFTLATPSDANVTNHYYWTFNTSSTAPTITWPAGITSWIGGSVPTISASKHYEVSVLNGIGVYFEV